MGQPIETRWWNLMTIALDKGLCVKIEKHIDSQKFIVLLAKIYIIDEKPRCLFSCFDLYRNTEPFYKAEKFVREYKREAK